jgi:hypothetical protein
MFWHPSFGTLVSANRKIHEVSSLVIRVVLIRHILPGWGRVLMVPDGSFMAGVSGFGSSSGKAFFLLHQPIQA